MEVGDYAVAGKIHDVAVAAVALSTLIPQLAWPLHEMTACLLVMDSPPDDAEV